MNDLEILEMKKIVLRYMLNVTYGGIKTVKPNEEMLNDFQKEYKEVKEQLKNYHQN